LNSDDFSRSESSQKGASVQTFAKPKELLENPHYKDQKQKSLTGLSDATIDAPILELINSINQASYCFTIQSCYGHFIYQGRSDPYNVEPLPVTDSQDNLKYKIAYVCLCIEDKEAGKGLLESLKDITAIDPQNVQFCCAEWFWQRQVNSYALQVQPERFKHKDSAILGYKEALRIEKIRDKFFTKLRQLFAPNRLSLGN
jgi:hypothetical protein